MSAELKAFLERHPWPSEMLGGRRPLDVLWRFDRSRTISEGVFAALVGYMTWLKLRGALSVLVTPTRLLEGYFSRIGLESLFPMTPTENEAFKWALRNTSRAYSPDFFAYLVDR